MSAFSWVAFADKNLFSIETIDWSRTNLIDYLLLFLIIPLPKIDNIPEEDYEDYEDFEDSFEDYDFYPGMPNNKRQRFERHHHSHTHL